MRRWLKRDDLRRRSTTTICDDDDDDDDGDVDDDDDDDEDDDDDDDEDDDDVPLPREMVLRSPPTRRQFSSATRRPTAERNLRLALSRLNGSMASP